MKSAPIDSTPWLRRPFQHGALILPSNIWYAPLAGCSGFAFRRICARYRPGLMFCEMVKMQALQRLDAETLRLLDFDASMHPIGAQICGAEVAIAGNCARIVEDLGFDAIDLNCGCPVDKVTKDDSGSGLLKIPHRIGEIIAAMRAHTKLPVSLKVRSGWDDHRKNCAQIAQIAEAAGAVAITVHGRTRAQGYKGPADWSAIKECKAAAKSIKVLGNGDLFAPRDIARMFEETDCDGFVIARGALGQPWMCQSAGSAHPPQTIPLQISLQHLVEHVEIAQAYGGEHRALVELKKASSWYLQRYSELRPLKIHLVRAASSREGLQAISQVLTDIEKNEGGEESIGNSHKRLK